MNKPPPNTVQVISTENAEHYTWGDRCDGWFLLKSDKFHVIQERMPPRTAEVMHYHRNSRQMFYVLRGELTMRTEGKPVVIAAG
jgi:mannose-6-phosphate isomerase-like protein (cupin superfamily)